MTNRKVIADPVITSSDNKNTSSHHQSVLANQRQRKKKGARYEKLMNTMYGNVHIKVANRRISAKYFAAYGARDATPCREKPWRRGY